MQADAGNKRSLKTHRAVRACLDPFVPLTNTTATRRRELSLFEHNNVSRNVRFNCPTLTTALAIAKTSDRMCSKGVLRLVGALDFEQSGKCQILFTFRFFVLLLQSGCCRTTSTAVLARNHT